MEPTEFELGAALTLKATFLDVGKNQTLGSGYLVEFYGVKADNRSLVIGTALTDLNGVATLSWTYPNNGTAYAFMAWIRNAPEGILSPQRIISNPVQLTVGKATNLLLNVSREQTSANHTITGRLLNGLTPIQGKTVRLKVNETEYMLTTDINGEFSLSLNFPAVNHQNTTYQILAMFEGDAAQNVTIYSATPNATQYPAFTTIQYSYYMPSTNITTLTVEPQATTTLTPTQQATGGAGGGGGGGIVIKSYASGGSWLTTWHEYLWWYPWYRFHIKLTIGGLVIDVGFNPVLPFGETWFWKGLEIFKDILAEIWQEIAIEFIGVFISYTVAKGLSLWNWVATAITMRLKQEFNG